MSGEEYQGHVSDDNRKINSIYNEIVKKIYHKRRFIFHDFPHAYDLKLIHNFENKFK